MFDYHKIAFNLKRAKLKDKMKEKLDNVDPMNSENLGDLSERELKELSEYISNSRQYLEQIKAQCYQHIDSKYRDSMVLESYADENNPETFSVKPSVFLEQAYAVQAYDKENQLITNRSQIHINTGTSFGKHCDENEASLSTEERDFNEVGKLVGAINTAISQMNHIESSLLTLKKAKDNNDEILLEREKNTMPAKLLALPNVLSVLSDTAEKSTIIKQVNWGFSEAIYNMLKGIGELLNSIIGSKSEACSSMKKEVDAIKLNEEEHRDDENKSPSIK